LKQYASRLQAVSRQLLEVQENERRMLARELHDTVGQQLTALNLNLSIIQNTLPPELASKVGNRLDDSQKLLEDTTLHLRNVMVELRPPGIDEFGLLAALKEHAQRVARRSGFQLTISGAEPKPRFALTIAMALFRIAQEALNNTVKHAQASAVAIELKQTRQRVRLVIADDGGGFENRLQTPPNLHVNAPPRSPLRSPPNHYGMGMTTMRERAEAIGAELRIQSKIGQGTQVVIEMACAPAALTAPTAPLAPATPATPAAPP
jgi:two-component system sensor histidine kinase UhpB